MQTKPANNNATHWYALKVFNNRLLQMQESIQRDAVEYYGNKDCFYAIESISGFKSGAFIADPGKTVQTFIAMTKVDRTIPQRLGKNTLVSYSGEKIATNLASKRDVIRTSNKEHQVVTYKKPLVSSLMFIRCTETFLKTLKHNHLSEFSYYTRYSNAPNHTNKEVEQEQKQEQKPQTQDNSKPGKSSKQLNKVPAVIPDDKMDLFICYTLNGSDVQYLGDPKEIKLGDRVKVTEGPFKGLIGNIKRIKKDRKFVLTIGSIASFTIGGITHKMVEKIE